MSIVRTDPYSPFLFLLENSFETLFNSDVGKAASLLLCGALTTCVFGQVSGPADDLPQIKETPGFGKLVGRVIAVWLRPGDPKWDASKGQWQMRLAAPFAYEDRNGARWDAPSGSPIDGASIPKALWSALAGTPYTGNYREASVLHDRYCDVPENHTFRQIDRMFYEAMRCEGTGRFEAAVKYFAVLKFGPQDPHTRAPAKLPKIVHSQLIDAQELGKLLRFAPGAHHTDS